MLNKYTIEDYEKIAHEKLHKAVFDFFSGGSGQELTLNANIDAFKHISFIPRVLKGLESVSTSTTLLGFELAFPVLFAPIAFQGLAHEEGELAAAQSAARSKVGMIVSTMSTYEHDAVVTISRDAWFQLYMFEDRNISLQLIKHAEKCGYKAIVLTVDVPIMASRFRDLRNNFTVPSLNRFVSKLLKCDNTLKHFTDKHFKRSLSWTDIKWLKDNTELPIILKGVTHPIDAQLAIENNCAGIIVSNHGGRQLDSTLACIRLLPTIVREVYGKIPVLFDSGIRSGSDILKALLLGADAVLIGRPIIWGLASSECDSVVNILLRELEEAMILMGIESIKEIASNRNCIRYMD
jgi:isopentenyl diphosphate isomerase/L-lactate dehydrogenase-like FMN-dependent dehydrogenase